MEELQCAEQPYWNQSGNMILQTGQYCHDTACHDYTCSLSAWHGYDDGTVTDGKEEHKIKKG